MRRVLAGEWMLGGGFDGVWHLHRRFARGLWSSWDRLFKRCSFFSLNAGMTGCYIEDS